VWEYTWDAESRLNRMEMRDSVAAVLLSGNDPWVAIDFAYDWMGRRIGKTYQTSTNDPATSGGKYGPPILWMISRDTRYVYDGWMLSMSYKSGGSSLADQSFAWGPDLSGGYGGAGGIGGLVAYTDDEHDALNPSSLSTDPDFLGPMFPIYDGNGNVVKMVRFETAGSGAPFSVEARESASYEYGPFGENRSTTGELGAPASGGTHQGQRNPFRFSTKYTDAETGLVYYGYRYYSPSMGRWVSRDPMGEVDVNVYAAMRNAMSLNIDILGLRASPPTTSNGYQYGYDDTPNSTRLDGADHDTLRGGIGYLGLADIHFRAWLTVQAGYTRGYDDAANLLRHFLGGAGSTYDISFARMNRDDAGARVWRRTQINLAMAAAEALASPDSSIQMRSTRDTVANPGATSAEWVYAINGYRTWAKATVTQRNCNNYTMQLSFRLRDNYDFAANTWLMGGLVYDYELAILNGYGWARDFEVEGRENISIQWRKGQRFNAGTVKPVSRPMPRTRDRDWVDRAWPLG